MIEERIGYRYAKAVFENAVSNHQLDAVIEDMTLIRTVCNDSKDLQVFLSNPVIPNDQKHKGLKAIFDGKLASDLSSDLLTLAVDNNREMYLSAIASSFLSLCDNFKGIERAEITAAAPLNPAELENIRGIMERKSSKKVEITQTIDESLIGGFILKMGDLLFDGSTSTAIRRLGNEFKDTSYVKKI